MLERTLEEADKGTLLDEADAADRVLIVNVTIERATDDRLNGREDDDAEDAPDNFVDRLKEVTDEKSESESESSTGRGGAARSFNEAIFSKG